MNQTDPISDLLTRLRNANRMRADAVQMPHSRLKAAIAQVLKREGFIQDYTAEGGGAGKRLRLYLKYGPGRVPVIRGLTRVSKPGLRRYVTADALRPVRRGTGMAIVSTSKGLLTDADVRRQRVGGEWLCTVW